MFWADKLLENQSGKQIVNDSWTPSGIIHMGSLRGPVIHDVFYKVLKERGIDTTFMYGFDDSDVIDGLPQDLINSHSKYMGVPIYLVPSPDGNGTFGDYFGNKMKDLLDRLGIKANLYKTSEIYLSGKFDEAIRFVLDNAEGVRDVYSKIYNKEIAKDWFPLQVLCPNCGKLGTTKVTSWDGNEVEFVCSPDLVKWAEGCGQSGKISPFGGKGKMPWKVEWAAKWWTFGVTIEGAGKDHSSAGGSYDVAMELASDVFKIQRPLKFGYEFFLIDGKKMSSSKGLGLTGQELLDVLEPRVARFLMIHKDPTQTIEFNPRNKDIIPRLYDDYQKGAKEKSREYLLSQIDGEDNPPEVRFSTLAQWVQMPGMEDEIKKANAENWVRYVKIWVEKYAPDDEKFLVQEKLPNEAMNLSDLQKGYLKKISDLDLKSLSPEDLQTRIYEISKEIEIPSKDAFSAIYLALLGKNSGPKAAWLISSLDSSFIKERFGNI